MPKCDNCEIRKSFAIAFDVHFYGADCPYECEYAEEKSYNSTKDKKEFEEDAEIH